MYPHTHTHTLRIHIHNHNHSTAPSVSLVFIVIWSEGIGLKALAEHIVCRQWPRLWCWLKLALALALCRVDFQSGRRARARYNRWAIAQRDTQPVGISKQFPLVILIDFVCIINFTSFVLDVVAVVVGVVVVGIGLGVRGGYCDIYIYMYI